MTGLAGKRVLVTGGAGFVGSHIVDLLLREGSSVTVIDNFVRGRRENLATALQHNSLTLHDADIRDTIRLRELVAASDIVFHQAALRITHCAEDPRAAMEVMVDATFELVDAAATAEIEKLIFASSASIYGMAETFPTDESHHAHDNRTLYGSAKLFGEGLLRAFADTHGLNATALRYFNVYGPRMDIYGRYTEVLARWMERIDQGLPPLIFGDGSQTMDMIDVRDVARANIFAAKTDASGEVFNIGAGRETSLSDLARHLAASMGRPDLTPVHEAERNVNPVARRLAATGKASAKLGFDAAVPLEQGLADLVTWWRANRRNAAA